MSNLTQTQIADFARSGCCPACGALNIEGKYPGCYAGWILYYCEKHKPAAWRSYVAKVIDKLHSMLQYDSKWFVAGQNGTAIQLRKGNHKGGWDFKNIEANLLDQFDDTNKLDAFIEAY